MAGLVDVAETTRRYLGGVTMTRNPTGRRRFSLRFVLLSLLPAASAALLIELDRFAYPSGYWTTAVLDIHVLDAETGKPVDDAAVTLSIVTEDFNREEPPRTVRAADGRARFVAHVWALRPSFVRWRLGTREFQDTRLTVSADGYGAVDVFSGDGAGAPWGFFAPNPPAVRIDLRKADVPVTGDEAESQAEPVS
jgi:hypothetical protein